MTVEQPPDLATPVDSLADLAVAHWVNLVGLASLLLRDRAQAEDVVQDAVVKCLRGRPQLRDTAAGLAYLRAAVLNGARSGLRRRALVHRHDAQPVVDAPGADEGALASVQRDAVVEALRDLPRRQREAVVLRFWADATEKQAAQAMGVSVGAVKAYTSRGLAALAISLKEDA